MNKRLFTLILTVFFCNCKKATDDSAKTILSVQVLQDSVPVEGAIVTIALSNGETKPAFQNRLSDKNGIVAFSGVDNKFYYVYAFKECTVQKQFPVKPAIDLSNTLKGATVQFTAYIFFSGVVKVINNTSYTYEVGHYNTIGGEQFLGANSAILYPYTHSSKQPEIEIKRQSGPDPRPTKTYELPAICGDTAIVTID